MRYMVRTVAWRPDRLQNVEILRSLIPQLEVIVDEKRDGYATLLDACHRLDSTGGVLLEDDVLLCRNFTTRIEEIIQRKQQYVINFFEKPKVPLNTSLVGGSQFLWMQCIYLPPGFPGKMIEHFQTFLVKHPEPDAYDCLVAHALVKERMKYWRIRPCLVQHLPFRSTLKGSRPPTRQTDFFIDDLEMNGNVVQY